MKMKRIIWILAVLVTFTNTACDKEVLERMKAKITGTIDGVNYHYETPYLIFIAPGGRREPNACYNITEKYFSLVTTFDPVDESQGYLSYNMICQLFLDSLPAINTKYYFKAEEGKDYWVDISDSFCYVKNRISNFRVFTMSSEECYGDGYIVFTKKQEVEGGIGDLNGYFAVDVPAPIENTDSLLHIKAEFHADYYVDY